MQNVLPSGEKWPSHSWMTGGAQEPLDSGMVSELENLQTQHMALLQ